MKINILNIRNPFLLLAFFLLMALLSILGEKAYQRNRIPDVEFAGFQEILLEKEQAMHLLLERVAGEIQHVGEGNWVKEEGEKLESRLEGKGFTLLIYRNDSLFYWSDNTAQVPWEWTPSYFENPFVQTSNSLHLAVLREEGPYRLVGLILIKQVYPYQNKFLQNGFQKHFNLPPWLEVKASDESDPQAYPVYNLAGETVFYLSAGNIPPEPDQDLTFPFFLYLLTFLALLIFLASWFRVLVRPKSYFSGLMLVAVILFAAKELLKMLKMTRTVFGMEMFSSHLYAGYGPWSTLGDLVIFSVLSFFLIYLLYRGTLDFQLRLKPGKFRGFIQVPGMYALAGGWFMFSQHIFRSLIIHSSISFELHRLLDLQVYTFLALMAAGLLFFGTFLLLDTATLVSRKSLSRRNMMLSSAAGILVAFLVSGILTGTFPLVPFLFLLVFNYVLLIFRKTTPAGFRYNVLTLFVFLFSLLALYDIASISTEKERSIRKVLAVNLATEHDAVAELLLEDLGKEIRADSLLAEKMKKTVFTPEEVDGIFEHLQSGYFSGFWEQYYLEITLCHKESDLQIIDTDTLVNCYDFFSELVEQYGELLPDSNFWFMNDQSGRISYFGAFSYPFGEGEENTLFLQLDSRLTYAQLGYPELLLDSRFEQSPHLRRYSYAKYIDKNMVAQSGDFPYSLNLEVYNPPEEEFSFLHFDGFSHLVFRIENNRHIIISTPDLKWIDLLVDTSYLFVYFFLWMNLVLLLINLPGLFSLGVLNFKMRIQLAMVGILFLALILIGGGAVYYSISQYRAKHDEIIREKIQSVYVELDHKLGFEPALSPDWSSEQYPGLNDLLVKFSNVFYTDINLYDPMGKLLATSRPEIFEKGLTGIRIDNQAYRELKWNRKTEYVHRENIGEMRFLSAYVPFTNRQNELLAYLNLPYFTRQTALTREISLLVVAIVNISFLLLLLTIFLAVLISNKITDPLRMIQKKFSRLKLGRSYEKITYDGKDEIGELVGEYNRMVTELARSVEKLARSERESAWREMAKQVAHEIKNPLTPMKLSIQQIKRAYDDKAPNWEEGFERFTQTMIEQIENLSAIANAFSHFAQMPTTSFEPVDMVTKVRNITELFGTTENVNISLNLHGHERAMVMADKEQMIRVLTNLVKNSIQAIPEDRQGKIEIDLRQDNEMVIISISDNGKGIPDELADRLFMPNFTTKSSGMGLGLAIVRNIISNTGGSVHYQTTPGEGTTFTIELPLYKDHGNGNSSV